MPTSAPEIKIYLLGEFRVQVGPRWIDPGAWHLRKARSLIKLLALAPEHRLHREQVQDLLWPAATARAAANSLHQALHAARRALQFPDCGDARYLYLQGDLLLLCPLDSEPLGIDVEEFERLAARARQSNAVADYRAALADYRGDALLEDRYEDWAAGRQAQLRELHIGLQTELAQLYERQGDYPQAIAVLQAVLLSDPLHEEAHSELMRLFARGGQRQLALRQYDLLAAGLRRELETEPEEGTRKLYLAIRAGDFPCAMGSESSRGMAPPALASSVPVSGDPPRTQSPANSGPTAQLTNLPLPLSSFVGRGREKAEVQRLVRAARLLTLTGPGGCGKTRLALETARDLVDESSGSPSSSVLSITHRLCLVH